MSWKRSERAVAAARRSFEAGDWRLKSQLQRAQIMFQIVEHLQEVSEDWGLLESQNAGAALRKTAVVDVPLAIEWFRSMAAQALSIAPTSETNRRDATLTGRTRRPLRNSQSKARPFAAS